jgi:hypothetical protein
MAVVQELGDRHMANRNAVAKRLIWIPSDDVILMTDVAHFHLSGYVNEQNFRYWAEENPQ